jgi:acetyl esterase
VSARRLAEMTVDEARRAQAAERPSRPVDARVETRELAGSVPIRLFVPRGSGVHPLCVWFPGGGWVLDTLDTSAPAMSHVAAEAGCAVAVIRYRLAPEHRFPAPLDDCVEALRRLVTEAAQLGIDPSRVAVGGTSAGANLAAALALLSREAASPRLRLQVLVYPALLYGSDTESMRGDFPTFDGRDVEWCWSHYLAHADDGENALASPLLADLRGLPPALVVTAEHDPLRDEGELYAEKLRQAGVEVDVVRIAGAEHGFFSGTDARATSAQGLVAAALGRAFGGARG